MRFFIAVFVLMASAAAGLAQAQTSGEALPSGDAQTTDSQAATAPEHLAAIAWLNLIDSGRYQESWDAAAELFRGQMPAQDWSRLVAGVRDPIGAVQSRRLQTSTAAGSLPGAPDGEYMMLQFISSFANKQHAQERVTLMREGDVWRVAGYYIR